METTARIGGMDPYPALLDDEDNRKTERDIALGYDMTDVDTAKRRADEEILDKVDDTF